MEATRLTWLPVVLACVVLSLGVKLTLLRRQATDEVGSFRTGATAPPFTLPDLAGNPVSLRDVTSRHDVTVVAFWATWCLPCRLEMPELTTAWETHRDHGVALLAVSTDTDAAAVRSFVDERHITFPVLLDDGSVRRDYGVEALPTSLLIDRSGKIMRVRRGVASGLSDVVATYLERARTRPAVAESARAVQEEPGTHE